MSYIQLDGLWLLKTEYMVALAKEENLEEIADAWVAVQQEYYNIKD